MKKYENSRIWIWLERVIFPVILLLYPLRHINWGLDLWDTGYNYSNFQFMGTEHMDPMWLFSTYLANACGALLRKLPLADSLMGMNFYTGLFISALALAGYWFCICKIKMPSGIAFLGEILAVSLCWCPTAVLYNYLTYVLFLGGCILLYLGLREDKNRLLAWAGVCLGANVFVRFSNLPEAAMILAVWAYGIICGDSFKKIMVRTGWCILGYLCALGIGLLYLSLRYGFGAYVEGIVNLLGMTETASDYTAMAMVYKMIYSYTDMIYWIIRICFFLLSGVLICMVLPANSKYIRILVSFCVAVGAVWWLYGWGRAPKERFCSIHFFDYDSMLRPAIVFLMLAMFIGVLMILWPKGKREDKLISGIVILMILLTSLGSNNGVFPSINNLFVAGPYVFWMVWRLCQVRAALWKRKIGRFSLVLYSLPIKAMAVAFLLMVLIQGIGFGAGFVFVEADGAMDVSTQVENNEVLKGIYMSQERAQWMEEITAYVKAHGLEGKEVLLYGEIPALSYYLNMPPVFNSWPDLDSYRYRSMEEDMLELRESLKGVQGEELQKKLPVVILEQKYADLYRPAKEDPKFKLLVEFMEDYGYGKTFYNEKFVVFIKS